MDVITYPCSDGKLCHVTKRSPTMLHKKIVVYNSRPWGLLAYCVLWGISKWGVLSYFETSSSNFWRNIYIFSKLVSNTYWWYCDISMHFWCLLIFFCNAGTLCRWSSLYSYSGNRPLPRILLTLRWRHNERDSVSNHQPHDFLLNRLFRRKSKKISKICVTGLCEGNSPGTGEFPAQMASYAENVSIWWRHDGTLNIYRQRIGQIY